MAAGDTAARGVRRARTVVATGGTNSSCTPKSVQAIDDYCPTCTLDDPWTCDPSGLPSSVVYGGCGYLHFEIQGDVGDRWDEVYDAESGELVHYYSNGVTDFDQVDDCDRSTTAGVMPSCDDWSLVCGGYAGGGGVGGAPY